MNNHVKILKSLRQSVIAGNSTNSQIYLTEKVITIEGSRISVELPDNTILSTNLVLKSVENGKEIYHTENGYPLTISDSAVFINLYSTHDMAVTYYFDNN